MELSSVRATVRTNVRATVRATVRDVWRLALPVATRLLNEHGDLSRTVAWARRVAFHPPFLAGIEECELVLLDVAALYVTEPSLPLSDVLAALAQRECAAVMVAGTVSADDCAAADRYGLCLFALPADGDLRDVEKAVIRLIVEREAQLDRRGRQIYRQLAQLSIENRGQTAMAEALASITGKSVVIQDERLVVRALALSADCPFSEGEIRALLGDHAPQSQWAMRQPLDDKSPPCADFPLAADWACCVAVIVVEGRLSGYLVIAGRATELDSLDRLAAERGALVCAIESAKRRAVEAAEQRLMGDFLDALLSSGPAEEAALARRAVELGYALDRSHAALLFSQTGDASRPLALLAGELRAALFDSGLLVFLCPYGAHLALLCSAEDAAQLTTLAGHAQVARDRVAELAPGSCIAVGIGRPGTGLAGLRRSFAQAQESLTLAQTLFGGDRVLTFGDLGLYHLLCRLQVCEELCDFYDQTLAPLVAYDREHDTQFLPTLEAFFAHHGNVSQTAESLYLHRNSLLYRLERIHEITSLDLDAADDRFALQLALKLRPLVPA
ncbi:MAG: helix-turn-helix domain-containing protein [Anaerolineae bacterium]|nr:helix-turn-helix domain-containing protein [Anaerolineae bacterium]